jgi:ankyrin repeat protein
MSGDIYNQILLLLAAESSHEALVKLLLESGANPGHRASSLSLFYSSSTSEAVPIHFQVRSKSDLEATQESSRG